MNGKQPKLKIESTVLERFMEWIVAFAAIAAIIYTIIAWKDLPLTVPTRFSAGGQIEGYGNKISILTLIPVTVVLYIVLSLLQKIPHVYNYTVKITEENAQRQYTIAVKLMRLIKLEIVSFFSYLNIVMVLSAKEGRMVMGIGFVFVFVVVLFGTIFGYLIKSIKGK